MEVEVVAVESHPGLVRARRRFSATDCAPPCQSGFGYRFRVDKENEVRIGQIGLIDTLQCDLAAAVCEQVNDEVVALLSQVQIVHGVNAGQ